MDYFYINAITLGIVSMAFLISFWLPMPQRSLFFKGGEAAAVGLQSQQEGPPGPTGSEEPVMYKAEAGSEREKMEHDGSTGWCSGENVASAGHLLWQSFRESYSSRHLLFHIYFFQYTLHLECRSTEHNPFVLYDYSMCRMYSYSINLLDSIKSLSSYNHDDNVF